MHASGFTRAINTRAPTAAPVKTQPGRPRSPPRALESCVPAPCSPDAPLPHSLWCPREHACCPHARPPARAPPPRTYSLGRGSTVVTLGPPGAQPPVPGSPPRPAPPESLHSTRRRWNDALGSGYRGLPATAPSALPRPMEGRGGELTGPGSAPSTASANRSAPRHPEPGRSRCGARSGSARGLRRNCAQPGGVALDGVGPGLEGVARAWGCVGPEPPPCARGCTLRLQPGCTS